MTSADFIMIHPLNMEKLDKNSRLVGHATVYSRMKLYKYKARIYRCPNDTDDSSELYKVVIKRRHVVGYCMVFVDDDNYLEVPLFASLDTHYRVGKILSQIAADRMMDLGCRGIRLTASWNSLLHHYRMGMRPHSQKAISGEVYDQIIASGREKDIRSLGCIVMYLPKETIAAKLEDGEDALDKNLLSSERGLVGHIKVENLRKKNKDTFGIFKHTYSSGIENYTLIRKHKKYASIVLNYFHKRVCENGRCVYHNCLKEYPSWSVFCGYGSDRNKPNKTFAEYWSIRKSKHYSYNALLAALFRIALEAGRGKECPLLQIEADWDEHLSVFRYGFRTQSCPTPKTAEEITRIIENEGAKHKRQKGALNFNKLGSVVMSMEKEDAVAKGRTVNRVLNHRSLWSRCLDGIRRAVKTLAGQG